MYSFIFYFISANFCQNLVKFLKVKLKHDAPPLTTNIWEFLFLTHSQKLWTIFPNPKLVPKESSTNGFLFWEVVLFFSNLLVFLASLEGRQFAL